MCGAPHCRRPAKVQFSVPSIERHACLRHLRWGLASLADWPITVTPLDGVTDDEIRAYGSVTTGRTA